MKFSSKRLFAISIAFSGMALVACGGGSDSAETTSTTVAPSTVAPSTVAPSTVASTVAPTMAAETPTSTSTITDPVMPLTGLPIVDELVAIRPAIVAKIDNHPASRPQTGLN